MKRDGYARSMQLAATCYQQLSTLVPLLLNAHQTLQAEYRKNAVAAAAEATVVDSAQSANINEKVCAELEKSAIVTTSATMVTAAAAVMVVQASEPTIASA